MAQDVQSETLVTQAGGAVTAALGGHETNPSQEEINKRKWRVLEAVKRNSWAQRDFISSFIHSFIPSFTLQIFTEPYCMSKWGVRNRCDLHPHPCVCWIFSKCRQLRGSIYQGVVRDRQVVRACGGEMAEGENLGFGVAYGGWRKPADTNDPSFSRVRISSLAQLGKGPWNWVHLCPFWVLAPDACDGAQ